MKLFKKVLAIFISVIFGGILLTGCSSVYRISNFSSKQKFYDDFNDFAGNKKVKVTLSNDSSFYTKNIVQIYNDTLYALKSFIKKNFNTVPIKDLKRINYLSSDYKSAELLLNNGKTIKAEDIKMLRDSVHFSIGSTAAKRNALLPLDSVRTISYKNHWLGLITGLPAGIVTGFITGILGFYPVHTGHPNMGSAGETQSTDLAGSALIGTAAGTVIGGIAGWFLGHNYVYQFNP